MNNMASLNILPAPCPSQTEYQDWIRIGYKLFPMLARSTTRYIPQERVCSRKASKVPRALPSALLERALSLGI